MRRSKSILEELNKISVTRDRHLVVENRGEHVIRSAIHLIEQIEEYYGEDSAKDLTNRLINSIKSRDSSKFSRGVRKAVKEQKEQNKKSDNEPK